MLSSAALSDLEQMIDEVASLRRDLIAEIAGGEHELGRLRSGLKFARTFLIRLFTRKRVARLSAQSLSLARSIDQSRACLEACFVVVDYELSPLASKTHAALVAAHDSANRCQRIWGVTSENAATPDLRTAAHSIVGRSIARLDHGDAEFVRSPIRALQLAIGDKPRLLLYPTFLVTTAVGGSRALISFRDLIVRYARLRFLENERPPSDSAVVDTTWEKVNKNGAPDRRFKDNYRIPICQYGELNLLSASGLNLRFIFSDVVKGEVFATALKEHQMAVWPMTSGAVAVEASVGPDALPPKAAPASREERLKPFLADWAVLACLVIAVLAIAGRGGGLLPSLSSPVPPVAKASPPASSVRARRHGIHGRHFRRRGLPLHRVPSGAVSQGPSVIQKDMSPMGGAPPQGPGEGAVSGIDGRQKVPVNAPPDPDLRKLY